MVKGILRITGLGGFEILLPPVVGGLAIGDVSLQGEPVARARDAPVVRQGNPDLRHRTGVDTEGLRTRTQFLVLQFHRLFLGTYGEYTLQPAGFYIGLLHDEGTRESCCQSQIDTIAHTPAAPLIVLQRTHQRASDIAVGLLQRTQAVFVGIEPQGGMIATRQSGL